MDQNLPHNTSDINIKQTMKSLKQEILNAQKILKNEGLTYSELISILFQMIICTYLPVSTSIVNHKVD